MDLTIARADIAFRDEVRLFLETNVPRSLQRQVELTTAFLTEPDISLEFHKALHKKGWSVFNWPIEYGGPGWTAVQRYIFDTECARYNAPMYNGAGRMMLAPVLMKFGRQDQKDFYLPRIASGEDHWAQGYSEPGAGSDLASLKTRAESDGDHYIVNGQKIWTTLAHKSNRVFALVRTSNAGKRQEGITFLLIDMKTPGITVKPIIVLDGAHEVNEVFFDNVKVPVENRVGEENKGWTYAKFLLVNERSGIAGVARSKKAIERLKEIGRDPDYAEERQALEDYSALLDQQADAKVRLKAAQEDLEVKLDAKYTKLTEDEIKSLVVDDKWLATISAAVQGELDAVSQTLTGRIRDLAKRYVTTLPQLTDEVAMLAARVDGHLKRMGAVWK